MDGAVVIVEPPVEEEAAVVERLVGRTTDYAPLIRRDVQVGWQPAVHAAAIRFELEVQLSITARVMRRRDEDEDLVAVMELLT